MNKKLKISLITALILFLTVCLIVSSFWLFIKLFLPDKTITFNTALGELTNVQVEEEKAIITVNYYSNHDNSGLEMFEIKINGYVDENQINEENPKTYAKGIQLIGTEEGSIKKNFVLNDITSYGFINETWEYRIKNNNDSYYYDSQNGTSFYSVDRISDKSLFRVSMQNDNKIYGMRFYQDLLSSSSILFVSHSDYKCYDINSLAYYLLGSVKSSSNYGSSGKLTIDLGEHFEFAEYKNGSYSNWINGTTEEGSKINKEIFNYFSIKFNISESGVTNANQSIFKTVKGQSNYLVGNDYGDYDYGKPVTNILHLTENNFDYILNEQTNNHSMVLNTKTKDFMLSHSTINMDINIDLNILKANGINVVGFDNLSGLIDFKDRINFIKIKTGETIREVQYDTSIF